MSTLQHNQSQMILEKSPELPHGSDQSVLAERVIQPSRGWIAIDWAEIFYSRELFDTLVMRDIKVRYKQTVLGVIWAVLQPIASVAIFTMVFSNFKGVVPENIPYPLFLLAAMVPWTFFTNSVTSAGTSLLNQQHLMSKIYFPRLYVPASTVGTYMIDMAIGLALFAILMPIYHFVPSWHVVFLPFVIMLTFAAALGLGLVFASVTILYRDLRFVIPFLLNMLMYASPIFYQQSVLPKKIQFIVALNPVTGIITAYRWCILDLPIDLTSLLISIVTTITLLVFGLFYFRRTERFIADLI